jgi:hypothetical protein
VATALMSTLAAGLVGAFCWRTWWSIGFAFAIPILVGLQARRAWALGIAVAYFAAASWPLVRAYAAFADTTIMAGCLAWIVAAVLLALPQTFAWTRNRTAAAWRIPIALSVGVLPPFGLVGWASPVTSAGVLFPGTAWLGLAAAILAPGLLLLGRPRIWIAIAAASVLSFSFSKPIPPPSAWAAIQTNLVPGRRFEGANELIASDTIQRILSDSDAAVTILPETVISRWTEATEAFWEPTLEKLHRQHRLAVIGAGVAIPDSPAYRNAALIIGGGEPQAFFQRVPVPVGMWRPLGSGPSVPLRLGGPGTIEIAGQRVAFLICYEQLLVLPVLLSAIDHPTLIVGMANQYWVRETTIPAAQQASLMAWSRLFALPLLIAENK